MNAIAYTMGKDIVFGGGQYQPNTLEGRKLLAHELVHVGQSVRNSRRINRNAIYRRARGGRQRFRTKRDTLTRAEEITLSRTSPGLITGENNPLTIGLYNFGIDVGAAEA